MFMLMRYYFCKHTYFGPLVADLHSGMGACYFISVVVKTQSLLDLHICVS